MVKVDQLQVEEGTADTEEAQVEHVRTRQMKVWEGWRRYKRGGGVDKKKQGGAEKNEAVVKEVMMDKTVQMRLYMVVKTVM